MHFTDLLFAEDVGQAALQVAPEAVDGHHCQRASVVQGVMGVEQQLVNGVVAGLSGQVRDDEVVVGDRVWQFSNPVAEVHRRVVQPAPGDVLSSGLDGADVAIHQIDSSIGPSSGEGEADCSVAAAEIEDAWRRRQGLQFAKQQLGAFVNRAGREQTVSRAQHQLPASNIKGDFRMYRQSLAQLFEVVLLFGRLVHGASIRAETGVNVSMCSGSMRLTMPG